jgi:hypothetical protein
VPPLTAVLEGPSQPVTSSPNVRASSELVHADLRFMFMCVDIRVLRVMSKPPPTVKAFRAWIALDRLQQDELLAVGLAQVGHTEAEQAQGARHQVLAGQEETAHSVDVAGFGQRVFEGDLAGEGRKVAIAHLNLNGVRAQTAVLEPGGDVGGLFPQAGGLDCGARRINCAIIPKWGDDAEGSTLCWQLQERPSSWTSKGQIQI